MEQKDLKEFTIFMSILQETFSPDKPISKERMKIYFDTLKDIPIANIGLGVEELKNNKMYPIFPLPAEIRKAAGFAEEDVLDLRALEAFREAESFLCYRGIDIPRKPPLSDPYIEKAIRLCFGGWESFGRGDSDDVWERKHFVEVYKKLIQTDKRDNLLSQGEILKQIKENRESMKTIEEAKKG